MVNHYRYKVKISAKSKVRSIDIPVGELPNTHLSTDRVWASQFNGDCLSLHGFFTSVMTSVLHPLK